MSNLKARFKHLKQNSRRGQPVVVVQVQPGETKAQAFARLGIDSAKLPPEQLVVIIDR